jgi:PAS domain S-box-containing protein
LKPQPDSSVSQLPSEKLGNTHMNQDLILKLFLVDDDEFDAMAFDRALKKSGINYSLRHCNQATKALEIIQEDEFDLVFLDYQMPGTDGLALLKKFKGLGVVSPIAILTSQGDEKIAVEMMKAGAFDYFPKNELTSESLSKIIRAGLRLREAELKKQQAERALIENNAKLNAILESTKAMVFSVDRNLKFTALNSVFRETTNEVLGKTPEIGASFIETFEEHETSHMLIASLKKSLNGEHVSVTEEFGKPDGVRNFYDFMFNPIVDLDGIVSGAVVYGKDITERKKVEWEILESKIEAERTAKAKSEFLSNMSHEIRTPMNAIIGLSELLLKENLNEKQLENLKSIKYSADNLLVIINDILDFSKIESGKIDFEQINFDLYSKIHEIRKTFMFKAEEKGIGLKVNIDERVPQFLSGDPFRLNQILLNLLSNAIKFTKEGHVGLNIQLIKENKASVSIEFSVSDTGIGIPKDKLAHVFESYTQAYTDITRRFGGTGLGLAITKQLVEMQGGVISLSSEVGKGTTFSIVMEIKKGEIELSGDVHDMVADLLEKRDFQGMAVLLVEDNPMNQFVANQVLELWNIKVDFADDGLQAVNLLKENDYALVLMDLQMPVMSGYEATEYIRDKTNKLRNPEVPIIALTADAFPETRKKVLESGMNDFVTKPLEQNDLYAKIKLHALKNQYA